VGRQYQSHSSFRFKHTFRWFNGLYSQKLIEETDMPISKDLFLAILAMDSYNRGYNPGVVLPQSASSAIGNATLGKFTNQQGNEQAAVAASFFAQAYELTGSYAGTDGAPGLTSGQTVISYRGTDDLPVDALTGYGTGAGSPLSTQAEMALRFYQSVAGTGDPRLADIALTGHSPHRINDNTRCPLERAA
jgi:hypothetical protein